MQERGISKLFKPQTYFFVTGFVIALSVLAFVGQPVVARKMDDWRLLPRPERLTELYFTDYRQLPTAEQFDTAQTVTFTVHNLEHQTTTYAYTLTAQSEDDKIEHSVGGGEFALAHDDSATTIKPVTLPNLTGRVIVKVNLQYQGIAFGGDAPTDQKQSIHYWTATDKKPDQKEADLEGV
jgi:hypothetical protein